MEDYKKTKIIVQEFFNKHKEEMYKDPLYLFTLFQKFEPNEVITDQEFYKFYLEWKKNKNKNETLTK